MQEILETEVTDFEPERVVNFDEDETTNFLVLSDETVKAESSEEVNTLVSADFEHDTYVFSNADDTLLDLESGSDFYIQPDKENIIAIKVDSVEKDGDTVTVKGENNVEEILAFAKFESVSYLSDGEFDTTDADEEVDFPDLPAGQKKYAIDPSQGINFMSKNVGIENSGSASKTFSFDASKADEDDSEDNSKFPTDSGFSFTGSLKITVQFNFYKSWTYTSFDMTITPEFSATVKLEGEVELQNAIPLTKKIKLGEVKIPTNVPGVNIEGTPKFVVKLSGSIAVTVSYAPVVGFSYDSDNGLQKISQFGADQIDASFDIEGTLFVGLELDAGVSVIDDDIAFAGFTCSAGVTFSIEGSVDLENNLARNAEKKSDSEKVFKYSSDSDALHTCRACFEGSVTLGGECGLKFKVFSYEVETTILKIELPLDFLKFHISIPKGFGFGECGNNKYKALFIVRNKASGDRIAGADVTVDGITVTTDGNGEAYLFCDNGSYKYDAVYAGTSVGSGSFTVNNSKKTVVINVNSKADKDGNVTYSSGGKEESTGVKYTTATKPNHKRTPVTTYTFARNADEVISSAGQLGDNIYYMRYPSGYVYIYGHGEMTSSGNPFSKPETITNVVIENDNEAAGSVITNIRPSLFKNCSGMTSIAMPNSITSIGNNAFDGCSSLEQIIYDKDDPTPVGKLIMPTAITDIGSGAFKSCEKFTELIIPSTISDIKADTFAGCSGITGISIPSNVKTVKGGAFSGCSSAKTIVAESGVETLEDSVFAGCTSLEELTLPFASQNIKNSDELSTEYCITDLFGSSEIEGTYLGICIHSAKWYIPSTLKTINITGGTVIPTGSFMGLSGVENITVPDTVTTIGGSAFANCSSLKKAVLPKSLQTIGDSAFMNCASIPEVKIAKTVTSVGAGAFSGCTSLKTAVIEGGSDKIGTNLFNKCTSLESITLPFAGYSLEAVNKAGTNAALLNLFNDDCGDDTYPSQNASGSKRYVPKSLKKITITGGERIPNGAFYGFKGVDTIVIPDSVTELGDKSFGNCEALTENIMTDNIISVGSSAFEGCTGIKKTVFGKKLTTVGSKAFAGCTGLTEVTVPETVTSIGDRAFQDCTSLKDAVIEGGSNKIGTYLFNKCTALESFTLPFAGYSLEAVNKANSNASLLDLFADDCGDDTYKSLNYSGSARYVPKTLKKITITGGDRIPNGAFYGFRDVDTIIIPDSVTELGRGSFGKCESLTENVMTDNIVSVGNSAFADCTGIKKAVFGEKLTTIGDSAFAGCTGLTEVTVPETVLSLGSNAFSGCSSLRTAEIKGSDTTLGSFIFNKCTSLEKLILPFAGYSLEAVNKENSSANLIDLFKDDCGDDTYKSQNTAGAARYIPKSLRTIEITGGNRIPNHAFNGFSRVEEFIIPESVSAFGNYSFANCEGIKENVMTDKVATIGDHAFENCTGISSIYIGENVKSIGNYAFAGCTGVTEATVPSTVTKVGNNAFSGCTSLKDAVISDGVLEIGDYVFNKCASLESLTLPFAGSKLTDVNTEGTNDYIADLFYDDYEDEMYKVVNGYGSTRFIPKTLRSITVTGGERIPNKAFVNLSKVQEITIPNTISYIGNGAFSGCESIADVFFPDVKEKWDLVSVDKNNEAIDGKVRYLDSEGNYVTPSGTITTTVTSTTKRTGIVKKCAVIEYPKSEIGIYQAA